MSAPREVVATLETLLSEFVMDARMARMSGDWRREEIAERRFALVQVALDAMDEAEEAA